MLTHYFSDPVMLDLIQHTPAFPYLDCLSAELVATGYKPTTIQRYLRGAAHVSYWQNRRERSLTELDSVCIEEFPMPSQGDHHRIAGLCPLFDRNGSVSGGPGCRYPQLCRVAPLRAATLSAHRGRRTHPVSMRYDHRGRCPRPCHSFAPVAFGPSCG